MKRTLAILLAALGLVFVAAPAALADTTLWYDSQTSWNSDSHLYSYDLATGAKTDYGVVAGVQNMTDLTFDDSGGLYALAFGNMYGGGKGRLLALTPGSASAPATFTSIPITGNFSGSPNGLAFRDGALFVSTWDRQFYKLTQNDQGSGWTVAARGQLGYNAVGDLAFGPDGRLYAALIKGNSTQLGVVDYDPAGSQFGKATLVGAPLAGFNYVFGLGYVGDTLYGTACNDNFDSSKLVTIDPTTGATTVVADFGQPVWGMAVTGGTAPIPEPATVALLGAGLVALGLCRRRDARKPRSLLRS